MTNASDTKVEGRPRLTPTKRKKPVLLNQQATKSTLSKKEGATPVKKRSKVSEAERFSTHPSRDEQTSATGRRVLSETSNSLLSTKEEQTSSLNLNHLEQSDSVPLPTHDAPKTIEDKRHLEQAASFPVRSVDKEQTQAQMQNDLSQCANFPTLSVDKEQTQALNEKHVPQSGSLSTLSVDEKQTQSPNQIHLSKSGNFSTLSADVKQTQDHNENLLSQFGSFSTPDEEQTQTPNQFRSFPLPIHNEPATISNKIHLSQCRSSPTISDKKGQTPAHKRSSLSQSGSFPSSTDQEETSVSKHDNFPKSDKVPTHSIDDEQTSASNPTHMSHCEHFPSSVHSNKENSLLASGSFATLAASKEPTSMSASTSNLLSSAYTDKRETATSSNNHLSQSRSLETVSTVEDKTSVPSQSQLLWSKSFATISAEDRLTSSSSSSLLSQLESMEIASTDKGESSTPTQSDMSEFLKFAILSADDEADDGADDEDNDVEPLTPNPSQVTLSESCMSTTSDLCAETDCSQNAKERKKKRRAEVQLLLEYTRDMFHRLCMKEKHLQCLVCNSHTENGIEQRTRKKSKTKETDKSVQEVLGRVLESLGSVLCKRLLCLDRRVLRGVMCRSKEGYPLLTGTNQRRKKKIQTRKRRGNLQLLLESSGNLLSQRLRCLDGRSLKGLISKPKAGRKHRAGQDKKAKPDNAVKIGTKRKKQELELSEPSQSNATGNKEEHPKEDTPPKKKVHFNSIVVCCSN